MSIQQFEKAQAIQLLADNLDLSIQTNKEFIYFINKSGKWLNDGCTTIDGAHGWLLGYDEAKRENQK